MPTWTATEIEWLVANYRNRSLDDVVAYLAKRTRQSVHQKAFKLGLTARYEPLVIGEVRGLWTIESEAPAKNGRKQFTCRCACSPERLRIVGEARLKNRGSKSCGCLQKNAVRKYATLQDAFIAYLLQQLQKNARHRKQPDVTLSCQEIDALRQCNCYYCDAEPCEGKDKTSRFNHFKRNGIDRLQSDLTYTTENCVPCCTTCNVAKARMAETEFAQWIKRVASSIWFTRH